jgi:mannan endo-1,6-alpha-mannosidase
VLIVQVFLFIVAEKAHNMAASIKDATAKYAKGLMSFYKGDAEGLPKEEVGVFPKPPYVFVLKST